MKVLPLLLLLLLALDAGAQRRSKRDRAMGVPDSVAAAPAVEPEACRRLADPAVRFRAKTFADSLLRDIVGTPLRQVATDTFEWRDPTGFDDSHFAWSQTRHADSAGLRGYVELRPLRGSTGYRFYFSNQRSVILKVIADGGPGRCYYLAGAFDGKDVGEECPDCFSELPVGPLRFRFWLGPEP